MLYEFILYTCIYFCTHICLVILLINYRLWYEGVLNYLGESVTAVGIGIQNFAK